MDGAESYELVIYRAQERSDDTKPVLRQSFPGSVHGWTPSLGRCLERGGRYAWSVRAVAREGASEWSSPRLFEVVSRPSAAELEAALAVVRRYVGTQERAQVDGAAAAEPVAEREAKRASAGVPVPGGASVTALSVDRGIVAASFTGDGSTLTALDPANLSAGTAGIDISGTAATASDLGCMDCVSEPELDFDTATQSELTAHGAGATAHHTPPTTLPPSGPAGGDLTGTYPSPGVVAGIARDSEVTAAIASHAGLPDAHREHATLEESTEIDTDIASHAALASIHHTPTVDTTCNGAACDGTNFTNLQWANLSGVPTTSQGDLLVDDGADLVALPVGTDGQVLVADSGTSPGVAWNSPTLIYRLGALVARTGQTTSYAIGDDGDLERGLAWPNPRFTDNGDGTVTDNLTGLIWLEDASCAALAGTDPDGQADWATALAAAASLADGTCGLADGSQAGDWRLPNSFELKSLVDLAFGSPALSDAAGTAQWSEGDAFSGVQSTHYWSSTTSALLSTQAWFLFMGDGLSNHANKTSTVYVWPLRGGQ